MRQIEILFYGMACFDRISPTEYRVLFPDGRNLAGLGVPEHVASAWVRERKEVATVRWPWVAFRNDYIVGEPRTLSITGAEHTTLDDTQLIDRLTNLTDCDPEFTLAATPETIIELTIDRGILSSHQESEGAMIIVRWELQVEDRQQLRFSFGNDAWIEPPTEAVQIVLANAGADGGHLGGPSHFRIYERLAADKSRELKWVPPRAAPDRQPATIIEPTNQYRLMTPFVDCSAVFSH